MGLIYRVFEDSTGMSYVGQTKNSLSRRLQSLLNPNNPGPLMDRMNEVGHDKFTVEVLEDDIEVSDLDSRECFWIDHFNSMSPNGFNLRTGGISGYTQPITDEHRIKLSRAHIGNSSHKGEYKKRVQCVETGELYDSITEASEKTGIRRSHIANSCNTGLKTTSKITSVVNATFRFTNEKYTCKSRLKGGKAGMPGIPIRNTETGELYSSHEDAERRTKWSASHIRNVCKKRAKGSFEYIKE
jgi:group I intron endonuclease